MLARRNVRSSSGFTLIELMIVIVIIGVLAATAIPNFVAMQSRAKEAEVKVNCKTVALAAEDFCIVSGGIYPTSIAQMTAYFPQGNLLHNPFTGAHTEPTLGNAPLPGEIQYEAQMGAGVAQGYWIRGGGKDGVVVFIQANGSI